MIDVAGIEANDRDDVISQQMQQRARQMIEQADIVILVRDCTDDRPPLELPREPDLCIATKIDLGGNVADRELPVSAHIGENLERLRSRLDELAFGPASSSASARSIV